MASTHPLFAWAHPAFFHGSPWDHTWVTTYDNRISSYPTIGAVTSAAEDYWYCWGSFHPLGSTLPHPDGFLGSMPGDRALAQCICLPNVPSNGHPLACGTIFTYGIDGVCHQLANQVLWSTGKSAGGPLTVHLARGYGASTFMFGSYGRQLAAWRRRLTSCGVSSGAGGSGTGTMVTSAPPDFGGDEFENRARTALRGDEQRLARLVDLRRLAVTEASQFHERMLDPNANAPSAEEINETYNRFFYRAAELLGKERFEEIFGVPADEPVDLVDPEVFASMPRPANR